MVIHDNEPGSDTGADYLDSEELKPEDSIGTEEEWFPKIGLRHCVRITKLKRSLLEKDSSEHTDTAGECYRILDQLLTKWQTSAEAKAKFSVHTLRTIKRSHIDTRHEACLTGIAASKLASKPPYKMLDLLLRYKLISSFMLEDNNITTLAKRAEIEKQLKKEKGKKTSNKKMVEKLEDDLIGIAGRGQHYFKITDSGIDAMDMMTVENTGEDDPLRCFYDMISHRQN